MQDVENALGTALEEGWTVERLRDAIELSLAGRLGRVRDEQLVGRRPVTTRERGIWEVQPESSFLDLEDFAPNELRHLRVAEQCTLEELADRLGKTVSDVALWEQGAAIPDDALDTLSRMFGVSTDFLLGDAR